MHRQLAVLAGAPHRTRLKGAESDHQGRLAHLLDTAAKQMVHVDLDRVSPMAVPVLIMIGRETVAQGAAEDAMLIEAEALAVEAMRVD